MKKKFISSLILAVLLFTMLPFINSVSAATETNQNILDGINAIKTNTRYYGLGQCYGFARKTFAELYGLSLSDVSWSYKDGTTSSEYLYVVMNTETTSEISLLLSKAQTGDILSYGGGSGNPHSMIFLNKDDESQQITVLDANWGAYNIIQKHTIPYRQLNEMVDQGNILALFRYTPLNVTIDQDAQTLYLGTQDDPKTTLSYTITPDNGITPTWSSSDESVAIVDQNGVVTAVAVGTTEITCQVANKSDRLTITVALSDPAVIVSSNRFMPLVEPFPYLYDTKITQIAVMPAVVNNQVSFALGQKEINQPIFLTITPTE